MTHTRTVETFQNPLSRSLALLICGYFPSETPEQQQLFRRLLERTSVAVIIKNRDIFSYLRNSFKDKPLLEIAENLENALKNYPEYHKLQGVLFALFEKGSLQEADSLTLRLLKYTALKQAEEALPSPSPSPLSISQPLDRVPMALTTPAKIQRAMSADVEKKQPFSAEKALMAQRLAAMISLYCPIEKKPAATLWADLTSEIEIVNRKNRFNLIDVMVNQIHGAAEWAREKRYLLNPPANYLTQDAGKFRHWLFKRIRKMIPNGSVKLYEPLFDAKKLNDDDAGQEHESLKGIRYKDVAYLYAAAVSANTLLAEESLQTSIAATTDVGSTANSPSSGSDWSGKSVYYQTSSGFFSTAVLISPKKAVMKSQPQNIVYQRLGN